MEEGKKMFSIFAARMFEQRVLQAYLEKVAQERQLQLLREIEDEAKANKEREARKAKENQKKKDKKRSVLLSPQHPSPRADTDPRGATGNKSSRRRRSVRSARRKRRPRTRRSRLSRPSRRRCSARSATRSG